MEKKKAARKKQAGERVAGQRSRAAQAACVAIWDSVAIRSAKRWP
jgi:hypothetical protein